MTLDSRQRYTVGDNVTGLLGSCASLKEARRMCMDYAQDWNRVTVYDRMARVGCTQEWEFSAEDEELKPKHKRPPHGEQA